MTRHFRETNICNQTLISCSNCLPSRCLNSRLQNYPRISVHCQIQQNRLRRNLIPTRQYSVTWSSAISIDCWTRASFDATTSRASGISGVGPFSVESSAESAGSKYSQKLLIRDSSFCLFTAKCPCLPLLHASRCCSMRLVSYAMSLQNFRSRVPPTSEWAKRLCAVASPAVFRFHARRASADSKDSLKSILMTYAQGPRHWEIEVRVPQ